MLAGARLDAWWTATARAPPDDASIGATSSHFLLSGVRQTFDAVPPASLPLEVTQAHLEKLVPSMTAQADAWDHAAYVVARRRTLRVAVLGCSTTNGCGSADPDSRCDAARAWPRLFHDAALSALPQQLPGWRYGVRTSVYAKNAVDPSYFGQCTASFVDSDTHVVLLEFFTNLFGVIKQGNHSGLDATVAAVREVAPQAAIVFVVWLKEVKSRAAAELRAFIEGAARRQRAELLDVPRLLQALAARGAPRAVPVDAWYANQPHGKGKDHHPNGAGHALLANASAHLLARRLARAVPPNAWARDAPGGGVAACAGCRPTTPMSTPWAKKVKTQTCFNSADGLPVAAPLNGSWRLVDEGGAKGVAKLGYLSTQLHDRLALRLGALCNGSAYARLGYHMSTRPGQGSLLLSCRGCACRPLTGILAAVSPFPLVPTDALLADTRYFALPGQLNGSLSVTATTAFGVLAGPPGSTCTVRVEHVRSARPRSAESRVRIDSLALTTKCARNASTGTTSTSSVPHVAKTQDT